MMMRHLPLRLVLIRLIAAGLVALLVLLSAELRLRDRHDQMLREMIDGLRSECGQSSALIAEFHRLRDDITPGGYVVMRDFVGRFYNFSGGERRVIGARTDAPHTLWIFGNSGAMDLYLADQDTFASKLQRLMPGYYVRNRSAWGQLAIGQTTWLEESPVQRGDLVLFIDGFSDELRPERVQPAVDRAERYARVRGAGFWHFRQPSAQPFVFTAQGIPIDIPVEYFLEYAHLNERGTIIEAWLVYNELTVY